MQRTKSKAGRPATGRTKVKVGATLNTELFELAKKYAFEKGISTSSIIETALKKHITSLTRKPTA